jgi:uncharacterized SAM-binding protein YcdF (DUF218 family)
VTTVVWFLFSSGALVAFLLVGAVWIWRRPHSLNARRFILLVAMIYAPLSIYGISYGTGRLLLIGLRPLAKAPMPPGRTAIVLLGSGSFTARDWAENRFSIVDRPAASRVLEVVRVFKMTDAAWIISSGGLVNPQDRDEPGGQTMRDELVRLGVPASRVLIETKSRNTHDEAVIVRDMLKPLDVDHVVLVTSDIHMRRSLGTFRAAGIDAIPAIARPFEDIPWAGWVIPSNDGLEEAGAVWHEIIGLGYYFARGWYRF